MARKTKSSSVSDAKKELDVLNNALYSKQQELAALEAGREAGRSSRA